MSAAMDKDTRRRRSTTAVHSTPSQPRPSLYQSSPTEPPNRSASLRHRQKHKPENPQHQSLTRVKGQLAMDTPPRSTSSGRHASEMSWLRDQSPMASMPSTPRQDPKGSSETGASPLVNPTSALLQGLIKEQRASRGSRGNISEGLEDDITRSPGLSQSQAQSQSQEDTPSEKQRKINNALSAGLKQPREMGMREMDNYVSKINKLNFDLKLEIFHRTQQMSTLEKKLERMRELEDELRRMHALEDELEELRNAEEDNQRLRESNEELRQELDKRDQAITEAVELICQLEARVEELEGGLNSSRPSTARPRTSEGSGESGLAAAVITTPKAQAAVEIPKRTSSRRGTFLTKSRQVSAESRHLQRAPSFLREESKNTAALRSLYAPDDNQSNTTLSALTKTESLQSVTDVPEPDSPRLSILSECSDLNPYDSPTKQRSFDQLHIPIRKGPLTGESSDSLEPDLEDDAASVRIDQWVQPRRDIFQLKPPKRRDRASFDAFKPYNQSIDRGLSMNQNPKPYGQKSRLDVTVYGGARLPPTPDTMSTAYAAATNRSDGSIVTEKSQVDQGPVSVTRKLGRPRSMDELTLRRSSGTSGFTDMSNASRLGQNSDDGYETPTLFPYSMGPPKATQLLGPGLPSKPRLRIDEAHLWYDKAGNCSPSAKSVASEPRSARLLSSSPPLTPQDWVEAAKLEPRPKKDRSRVMYDGLRIAPRPAQLDLIRVRAPSQTAFLGRRHSFSSNPEEPELPPQGHTLPLRAIAEPPQPAMEPEPKKRLSLRPPFFGRSNANSRRLQPSPIPDADLQDGCAPSPVIRKTRRLSAPKRPTAIPGNGDLGGISTPTYADGMPQESVPKTLSHSMTESNLFGHATAPRPITSGSGDHKRRSSLGIFNWMKGAGTHNKRSEPNSPVASTHVAGDMAKERASSRLAYESADLAEAESDRYLPCASEEHIGRRPRYMDRRSRRA